MSEVVYYSDSWSFVYRCLKTYWYGGHFLTFFLIGLVITLFLKKEKVSRVFWFFTIVLGVTVYNPLIVHYVVPRFTEASTYYRLFWIWPVSIGLAYYFALAVEKSKWIWLKGIVIAAVLLLITKTAIINGNVIYNIRMPENVYKVPDSVIYACDIIHQDYQGSGEPRAVFTDEYEIYVRQYDPSIRLSISRDTRLTHYYGSDNTDSKAKVRRARILDVINSSKDVSKRLFRIAMRKTRTKYLVIPVAYTCHEYLKSAGCAPIAAVDNVIVYRFEKNFKLS